MQSIASRAFNALKETILGHGSKIFFKIEKKFGLIDGVPYISANGQAKGGQRSRIDNVMISIEVECDELKVKVFQI